ncbi:hypothetical protein [Saccharopolyspora hordei]|uniref:Transposase n=1 Tax=Saccharopolyspora hordei TaxID=1838 RepID=A0A853ASR9_9PSEU|nr:hypothetical protein [Saccharopolyspora hordei]NYI85421.1 hypothetical protein [Saccharopolyspora hordei]
MSELTSAEREELHRLRRENHLLRVEKEMLLRIATEYALDRPEPVVPREAGG